MAAQLRTTRLALESDDGKLFAIGWNWAGYGRRLSKSIVVTRTEELSDQKPCYEKKGDSGTLQRGVTAFPQIDTRSLNCKAFSRESRSGFDSTPTTAKA